jgi:hypothetical protein
MNVSVVTLHLFLFFYFFYLNHLIIYLVEVLLHPLTHKGT